MDTWYVFRQALTHKAEENNLFRNRMTLSHANIGCGVPFSLSSSLSPVWPAEGDSDVNEGM